MITADTLIETDVLVIGGGGAALRAAVEAAEKGVEVLLVDKGRFTQSGTSPLALHGFAVALQGETPEETLFSDFVRTGHEINDLDLVRTVSKESRFEPSRLERMGVRFGLGADGGYFFRGTGNSVRITFDEARSGMTFPGVLGAEARKRGVRILEGVMIADLLAENGRIQGAIGMDGPKGVIFSAKSVVLAAGGANRLYPNVVDRISDEIYRTTGDGYGLALRAGLPLVDMEFSNFRDSPPAFGINGKYVNAKGEAFMAKYAPQWKERAPRGEIVEAIYREMQAGRGPVYIDFDNKDQQVPDFMPAEYKNYFKAYKEGNPPPVKITFQRLLGGVRILPDASCELEGLYVAGENGGGLHGADRLQGAAFLETQVFGRLAGIGAAQFAREKSRKGLDQKLVKSGGDRLLELQGEKKGSKAGEILKRIHELTWEHAGVIRNAPGLRKGIGAIEEIREELKGAAGGRLEVQEVMNLALTAEVVMRAALAREETRGTHIRDDFQQSSGKMSRRHVSVRYSSSGGLKTDVVECRE